MKKIIINSNILWTITQFRKDLIVALKEEYEIVCIADRDEFSKKPLEILHALNVEFIELKINRKGLNPFQDVKYVWKLFSLYKKINPDLIIHYTVKPNIYGSWIAARLGIKSFAVVSGLGSSFLSQGFLKKMVMLLYKKALTQSQKVIFLNTDDRDIFVKMQLIKEEQILLLPGEGVDTKYYTDCISDVSNSTQINFLMVARLLKDKGIYEYIEAIKIIKSKNETIEFLLAGVLDTDNSTSITQAQLDIWVSAGYVNYLGTTDNIKDFLKKTDVIVLPSYREGLSRILLEACSCEKFIITSNVAGCKELCINDENGFLVKVQDTDSLVKAIEKTLSLGRNEVLQRAKKGRELVLQQYSSEIINEMYKKLIREFI